MKMRWFVGCMAVVCLIAILSAVAAGAEADRLCVEALKLQQAGKTEEALALYQKALAKDMEHHTAMSGCAKSR